MEILINDSPLGFEIENEKSLSEILTNIENWGEEKDLILASFKVNEGESEYFLEDDFDDRPLNEIDKIELEMHTTKQAMYETAESLKEFLNDFELELDKPEVNKILPALDWIEKSVNSCLEFFSFSNKQSIVNAIKEIRIEFHRQEKEKEVSEVVFEKLNLLKDFANRLVSKTWVYFLEDVCSGDEEQSPALQKEMLSLTQKLIKRTSFIAEKIQTGRDEEAMSSLEDFTEAYQLLNLYLEKKKFGELEKDGVKGVDLLKELKKTLLNIENSLKEEDLTELSDLIEYELGERLTQIEKFMQAG